MEKVRLFGGRLHTGSKARKSQFSDCKENEMDKFAFWPQCNVGCQSCFKVERKKFGLYTSVKAIKP